MTLFDQSIAVILEHQAPSGAYVASPTFPTYAYSWFRDGSFIAYAMDQTGNFASSRRFHDWVASVIARDDASVERAIAAASAGHRPAPSDLLHTRYTLDGEPGDDTWPNHQLDGFGTWLWALEQHATASGYSPSADHLAAAERVARYLEALWEQPCFDCWEEFGDRIHGYTLAAIDAGLRSHARITGADVDTNDIRQAILTRLVADGHFTKFEGTEMVDASLVALSVPYSVVPVDDPRMVRTVERIEDDLAAQVGVHRYAGDTYYGGGQWILLTCWLAWYHARCGQLDEAHRLVEWVERQATAELYLPEQVLDTVLAPESVTPWEERWGPVATPLLWSHAMYLIAVRELAAESD